MSPAWLVDEWDPIWIHPPSRIINALTYFFGVIVAGGNWFAAILLTIISTIFAVYGYGWHVVQALGVVLLFGAVLYRGGILSIFAG